MKKGMMFSIYRSDYDCELNYLYGKKHFILVGKDIPEIFEPDEDKPEMVLTKKTGIYAVTPPDHENTWYAMGGTFGHDGDSRMSHLGVLPIHDRKMSDEDMGD